MISRWTGSGRMFGIRVEFDRSLLLTFPLITAVFAVAFSGNRALPLGFNLVPALAFSVLFIASMLLHEFGHAIAARHYGMNVRAIRFFIFGGLTDIGGLPKRASHEFVIALAGPLVSATLGGMLILAGNLEQQSAAAILPLRTLGRVNLLLAVFNLLPIFPLDGGRALRAILWQRSGSFERGSRQSVQLGRLLAGLMVIGGAVVVITGSPLSGVFLLLVGWRLRSLLRARFASSPR